VPRQRLEGGRELIPAVAPERPQGISGQALRVEPRGYGLLAGDLPVDHGDMLLPGRIRRERDRAEMAESCGEIDGRYDGHFAPPWCRGGFPTRNAQTLSPRA
jgi:hypothetical protein